jgi:hypothetical protein
VLAAGTTTTMACRTATTIGPTILIAAEAA